MAIRVLITAICTHMLISIWMGFAMWPESNIAEGILSGLLISAIGFFYLVVEIPFAYGALVLFRKVRLSIAIILVVISGALIGNLLTIRVGGVRPPDYVFAYTIAGMLVGVTACFSGLTQHSKKANGRINEESVPPDSG